MSDKNVIIVQLVFAEMRVLKLLIVLTCGLLVVVIVLFIHKKAMGGVEMVIVTFRHLEREMERHCVCVEVGTVQQCKTGRGGTGTDGQQTARGGRETEPTSYLKLSFKGGVGLYLLPSTNNNFHRYPFNERSSCAPNDYLD